MTEEPLDVALLVPSWSELQDWKDRSHVYIHQRPLATAPGARVWLCKDRRLVYSYRIDGFVDLEHALPGERERHEEAGWALVVSDGRRANRHIDGIPDPHGVVRRWMQGFRYMRAGAAEFVRAPRRPRRPQDGRAEHAPQPAPNPEPVAAELPPPTSWARRVARLLGRRA
ncbi:MAG TPA: hypothetical protein VHF47_13970 [Acidimicrobiales bacterium]|nr:hypothetical protein [Acidimicrobiales bacterium]